MGREGTQIAQYQHGEHGHSRDRELHEIQRPSGKAEAATRSNARQLHGAGDRNCVRHWAARWLLVRTQSWRTSGEHHAGGRVRPSDVAEHHPGDDARAGDTED